MSFNINNNVQSGDITFDEFKEIAKQKNLEESKITSLFAKFNTDKTKNADGKDVLDKKEQVAVMAFFKRIAGKDNTIEDSEFQKFQSEQASNNGFAKDFSLDDLKNVTQVFFEIIAKNKDDNKTVTYNDDNTVTVSGDDGEEEVYQISQDGSAKVKSNVKTTYDSDGKTIKNQVTEDENGTTTTTFQRGVGGKQVKYKEILKGKDGSTTTTIYLPDGQTIKTQTVTKSGGTTITYGQGGEAGKKVEEEITKDSNGNKVVTNYRTKIIYTYKDNTIQEDSFTLDASGNKTITSTKVTDRTNHTQTITDKATGTKTIKKLNEYNSQTVSQTEFNKSTKTATFTKEDGSTDTLGMDNDGNVLATSKFVSTRMETVGETAIRLGYAEGSDGYKAIVQANGGANAIVKAGEQIKIPQDVAGNGSLKVDEAKIDATEQKTAQHTYTVGQNEINAGANAQKFVKAHNEAHKDDKWRTTWAGDNHQVYVSEAYANPGSDGTRTSKSSNAGDKNWQQHYIYDPETNKMVKIEGQITGLQSGEHVKRITSDGQACVINAKGEERYIKLNFVKHKATASDNKIKDYNKSFDSDIKTSVDGKDDSYKNDHKYTYRTINGTQYRKDVTSSQWQKKVNGEWTDDQVVETEAEEETTTAETTESTASTETNQTEEQETHDEEQQEEQAQA